MNLNIRELNELIYSLGITAHHGMLVNKELNESLLEKLYGELNNKLSEEDDDMDYLTIPTEDEIRSHYVSNEEADEDAEYTSKGVTQAILDFVENNGSARYKDMNEFYKLITGGSNSFSHILKALRIPYKNRLTRRYLAKNYNGVYEVRIASIHNWVEKSY
jgi:hypothetical protein